MSCGRIPQDCHITLGRKNAAENAGELYLLADKG